MPTAKSIRDRLPGALAAVLFHLALIATLLNAIPKYFVHTATEPETIIPLAPLETVPPRFKPRTVVPAAPGSTALSRYYYRFIPSPSEELPSLQGLRLALSSCAPENFGNASNEVRAACRRIGMLVVANPEALGLTPDFKFGKRWETELLIKQTPLLLPCASPYGGIDILYTLSCAAGLLENGYHPEDVRHYSK